MKWMRGGAKRQRDRTPGALLLTMEWQFYSPYWALHHLRDLRPDLQVRGPRRGRSASCSMSSHNHILHATCPASGMPCNVRCLCAVRDPPLNVSSARHGGPVGQVTEPGRRRQVVDINLVRRRWYCQHLRKQLPALMKSVRKEEVRRPARRRKSRMDKRP